MKALRAGAVVMAFMLRCAPAYADQTSVGITVNATTGSHVESNRASSIPALPLPMLEIDHAVRQYHIHLEGVPQLGPVPLAQSDPHTESLAPRVSYLNGELLYRSNIEPIELGIGETVLNQQTVDHFPGFLQDTTTVHYSRIAGMRLVVRGRLYTDSRHRAELWLAANPAMHGLEDGKYGEDASLFDGSLRWTVTRSRYDIVYGLRYLNYTAAYSSTHALGDRNHLFMPFFGIDWHGKDRASEVLDTDPPAPAVSRPHHATTLGVSLLGSNGTRTFTGAFSQTPLSFVLIPQLQASHSFGRYELQAQGVLPNNNTNPWGSSGNRWSYASIGALASPGGKDLSLGLGETLTNIASAHPSQDYSSSTRSAAIDLLSRLRFARTVSGEAYAFLRLDPYVHVTTLTNLRAGSHELSMTTTAHGARVDATLGRNVYLRQQFVLDYGLRYINQTTNYSSYGALLTRSTSLMPFVGLKFRF